MSKRLNALQRGLDAETLAARHLEQQGLKLLERNYRSRFGEIDLIMQHGNDIIFVEVRYRSRRDFGLAGETIDARKRHRLECTALHYLEQQRADDCAPRFDVVLIENQQGDVQMHRAKIEWIKNAFDASIT